MRAALARIVATGVIAVGSVGTALAADAVLGVAADTWTFSVSASVIYAARGDSADSVLIEDTVTGDTVLDASGFDLGWAPGVDLRAEAMNGTWGGGLRFLGGFSWDNTQTATSPAIWSFPTVPPLFGLGVANITAGYSSDLNSFEANGIWRATPRIVAFGGLRWIGIDEDLDMRADFDGNQATVSMDTSSQGIGPQIGAQVRAIEPGQMLGPVFLDLDGRVGALYMKHKADFGVQQTIGPAFESDGDDSEWSFVGEIGAAAGIQVSSNVDITLGYRLLYLSDVAVAPIQLPNVDVLSASVNPATSDYWIHGVTLGVNVRF